MAAMAQLDCGACGYLCKTYAEAIATGSEKDLNKCTPGGKPTSAKLKELVKLGIKKPLTTSTAIVESPSKKHWREQPFPAPLIVLRELNGPGSEKEVRHVEIAIKGSGIAYKAGDALGIWPENCLDLVVGIMCAQRNRRRRSQIDRRPSNQFIQRALRREGVITQPTKR